MGLAIIALCCVICLLSLAAGYCLGNDSEAGPLAIVMAVFAVVLLLFSIIGMIAGNGPKSEPTAIPPKPPALIQNP